MNYYKEEALNDLARAKGYIAAMNTLIKDELPREQRYDFDEILGRIEDAVSRAFRDIKDLE